MEITADDVEERMQKYWYEYKKCRSTAKASIGTHKKCKVKQIIGIVGNTYKSFNDFVPLVAVEWLSLQKKV